MNRAQRNRAIRLARRVLVDGRLVAPLPPEKHGLAGTYSNWGCRCGPCTEAANAYSRLKAVGLPQRTTAPEEGSGVNRPKNQRAARWARRVLVDGRLVAAHLPDDRHGLPSTYTNHGCQCGPCTRANSDHWRGWYQAKRQEKAAA